MPDVHRQAIAALSLRLYFWIFLFYEHDGQARETRHFSLCVLAHRRNLPRPSLACGAWPPGMSYRNVRGGAQVIHDAFTVEGFRAQGAGPLNRGFKRLSLLEAWPRPSSRMVHQTFFSGPLRHLTSQCLHLQRKAGFFLISRLRKTSSVGRVGPVQSNCRPKKW